MIESVGPCAANAEPAPVSATGCTGTTTKDPVENRDPTPGSETDGPVMTKIPAANSEPVAADGNETVEYAVPIAAAGEPLPTRTTETAGTSAPAA